MTCKGSVVRVHLSPPNKKTNCGSSFYLSKPQAWHGITLWRVWNCRRRMASPKVYSSCVLIPCDTSCQFHTATSCGFHTSLRDDYMLAFGVIWYEGARIVVRIPRSKIEELALQAQSAGILTLCVKIHLFYPSRRLGMASRSGVYGIAEGVWHHRRCILPAS